MAKKNNDKATVLAFEKKMVPSDGYMYGTTWEKRREQCSALKIKEKSVRGTISNRLSKAFRDDPLKLDAEVEKPNLQTVDACSLGVDQDTLKMHFTLKVLSGVERPSACNSDVFNRRYQAAAGQYVESETFAELARRYAINIANGRFLWRNRVGAEKVEVEVKVLNNDMEGAWTFDATSIGIRDFDYESKEIDALASLIAQALSGQTAFLLLEVDVYALAGKGQDVYPSEELVLSKSNGNKKSKVLYQIDGIAGMHSQKIGNALRTIDTWYPAFDDVATGPIAVEPYGAVTNLGKAYRHPQEHADFYTLFDRFARGEQLGGDEKHYVMAVLVRGGVFGESGKE